MTVVPFDDYVCRMVRGNLATIRWITIEINVSANLFDCSAVMSSDNSRQETQWADPKSIA
jgi:hypothetical protein